MGFRVCGSSVSRLRVQDFRVCQVKAFRPARPASFGRKQKISHYPYMGSGFDAPKTIYDDLIKIVATGRVPLS